MKIAVFFALCEGEFEITLDTLQRVLDTCRQHEFDLYIVDDASPSNVGARIIESIASRVGHTRLIRLPKSLGFWGTATRMMIALRAINEEDRNYDYVLGLDPDLFPVRLDLGEEIARKCTDRGALYGCSTALRKRDALLFLADMIPVGFRRRTVEGVSGRKWSLSRSYSCWWTDLGVKSLLKGYSFEFIGGSFWLLGGDVLRRFESTRILSRDESKFGLTLGDDMLLTIMTLGVGLPVVDLGSGNPSWQGTLGMGVNVSVETINRCRPYVVHPLKNNSAGWTRRSELKELAEAWGN